MACEGGTQATIPLECATAVIGVWLVKEGDGVYEGKVHYSVPISGTLCMLAVGSTKRELG